MSTSLCVSQSWDSRGGVPEQSDLRSSTERNLAGQQRMVYRQDSGGWSTGRTAADGLQAGQQRMVYRQATVLVGWITAGERQVGDGKETSGYRRCQMVVACEKNTERRREGLRQQAQCVCCDVRVCVCGRSERVSGVGP